MASQPLFQFGVIADVQYADADDAWDFHKRARRRYRHALVAFAKAVAEWNSVPTLAFVAQLGDLMDGKADSRPAETMDELNAVIASSNCKKWYHCIGNHENYVFSRAQLVSQLPGICARPDLRDYYDFLMHPGWRGVVLDSFDISVVAKTERSTASHEAALALLHKHNPNDVLSPCDWTKGLSKLEKRWVPYNGGISAAQLAWLRTTLAAAANARERVILFSHVPLMPGSCNDSTLVWNYDEVLAVIDEFPGTVVASFHGHDHDGGYALSPSGVHFLTLASPLQVEVDDVAHAVVQAFPDRLEFRGSGVVPTMTMPLPPLPSK